jgi:squalene-hopene/tetraprenyl-beta-curcumene cyclase
MDAVMRNAILPGVRWRDVVPDAEAFGLDQNGGRRRVAEAIAATVEWLHARQAPDGHWRGALEGDSILESEFILLAAWSGRMEFRPDSVATDGEFGGVVAAAAERLLALQEKDGGWAIHPGAASDASASVKAYFALKLVGKDPDGRALRRARECIRRLGGPWRVNSFTLYYLALLGQVPYSACPAVPPEMVLLPGWFPISLGSVSAWSRTMIVPLSLMWAFKPMRRVAAERGIGELFEDAGPAARSAAMAARPRGAWAGFFRGVDRMLKVFEAVGFLPLRRRAVAACRDWMLARFEGSDGLGAIFPPIVWSIIALRSLGAADDSPEVQECWRQLEGLIEREPDGTIRIEPCRSPVWDTAITLKVLAGVDCHLEGEACRTRLERAVDWLLDREIRTPGDWADRVAAEPSGWCFEYANRFYPDIDDTAMVLVGLAAFRDRYGGECRTRLSRIEQAMRRGVGWLEAMQNRDGGWAAFDRDNTMEVLCRVPFADHNAMIDPSSPDLTGRVLEALGRCGLRPGQASVDRAYRALLAMQEADGSWFGRWGVNYIYGTWQSIEGLRSVGLPGSDPAMRAAADWLERHQQPCGGWGESPESYADRAWAGRGVPTPSQTSWALAGLVAAGRGRGEVAARGARWLLDRQRDDGTWDEREFTGTGFPKVFYLRYHYYRIYFPLLALSRWSAACEGSGEEPEGRRRGVRCGPGGPAQSARDADVERARSGQTVPEQDS